MVVTPDKSLSLPLHFYYLLLPCEEAFQLRHKNMGHTVHMIGHAVDGPDWWIKSDFSFLQGWRIRRSNCGPGCDPDSYISNSGALHSSIGSVDLGKSIMDGRSRRNLLHWIHLTFGELFRNRLCFLWIYIPFHLIGLNQKNPSKPCLCSGPLLYIMCSATLGD